MMDIENQLDAIVLARDTREALDQMQSALARWYQVDRVSVDQLTGSSPACIATEDAYERYKNARDAEVAATQALTAPLKPKPAMKTSVERLRLWGRGAARLGAGVPLAIVWCVVGTCVTPETAKERLKNFALNTCCAGGVSDLKRANEYASKGIKHKREYQFEQVLFKAYMIGHFGPLEGDVLLEANASTNHSAVAVSDSAFHGIEARDHVAALNAAAEGLEREAARMLGN